MPVLSLLCTDCLRVDNTVDLNIPVHFFVFMHVSIVAHMPLKLLTVTRPS